MDAGVAKQTIFDKMVTKVDTIDKKISSASELVLKTLYNLERKNFKKEKTDCLHKKISNTTELVKKMIKTKKLQLLKRRCLILPV